MQFTYNGYKHLLELLIRNGYKIVDYDEYEGFDFCAILRHDVDCSLENALEISKAENELNLRGDLSCVVKSTFFIQISTELYNPFTLRAKKILQAIQAHGNEIGLHFSAHKYPKCSIDEIVDKILIESEILGKEIGAKVRKVSMHQPSKEIIEANLKIPGIVNAYSAEYYNGFKYLSDSNMRWREPIEEYINTKKYGRLQILTHPFWYYAEEKTYREAFYGFINSANYERYKVFRDEGIYGLGEVFSENDVR